MMCRECSQSSRSKTNGQDIGRGHCHKQLRHRAAWTHIHACSCQRSQNSLCLGVNALQHKQYSNRCLIAAFCMQNRTPNNRPAADVCVSLASQSVIDFLIDGGQLAHLTKLQIFISKQNRQNGNVDKQNHHQKHVGIVTMFGKYTL